MLPPCDLSIEGDRRQLSFVNAVSDGTNVILEINTLCYPCVLIARITELFKCQFLCHIMTQFFVMAIKEPLLSHLMLTVNDFITLVR